MTTSAARATTSTRREQIVSVAAGLFAQRGFHGVSIYDLGAALGISGPALYKHFASKDALLAAMLIDISERLLDEGERRYAAALEHGPQAALEELIGWHVEFALANPALITVQFRDLANLNETDQHTVRQLQRTYVERWVVAICAAFGADHVHARAAAHAVFALINSTPHSARLGEVEMSALLHRMARAALKSCAEHPSV